MGGGVAGNIVPLQCQCRAELGLEHLLWDCLCFVMPALLDLRREGEVPEWHQLALAGLSMKSLGSIAAHFEHVWRTVAFTDLGARRITLLSALIRVLPCLHLCFDASLQGPRGSDGGLGMAAWTADNM